MRRIMFRAWDKKKNKMLYPVPIAFTPIGRVRVSVHDVGTIGVDYEVMQYTGIEDCKRMEIYEGDIVTYNMIGWDEEINEKYNNQFKGIIVYNWDKFQIKYSDTKLSKCYHDLGIAQKVKVIGNIYENPELIK